MAETKTTTNCYDNNHKRISEGDLIIIHYAPGQSCSGMVTMLNGRYRVVMADPTIPTRTLEYYCVPPYEIYVEDAL
jgi:hypothetical protein